MAGRRNIASAGRSGASESLMRAGADPRARRTNQASLATNVELGDNLEIDSKQRMQVTKAPAVTKLDLSESSSSVERAINDIITALTDAGLMKGSKRSY